MCVTLNYCTKTYLDCMYLHSESMAAASCLPAASIGCSPFASQISRFKANAGLIKMDTGELMSTVGRHGTEMALSDWIQAKACTQTTNHLGQHFPSTPTDRSCESGWGGCTVHSTDLTK